MGRMWYRRIEMVGALGEIIGYKSGLALTREEIVKHIPEYESILAGDDNAIMSLRAEEYEEITSTLLYRLGCLASAPIVFPGIRMFHKYKDDKDKYELYVSVMELFLEMFPELEKKSPESKPINLTPFLIEVKKRYTDGFSLKIALEYIEEIEQYLYQNPWTRIRRHE
jgi:restriction system protein